LRRVCGPRRGRAARRRLNSDRLPVPSLLLSLRVDRAAHRLLTRAAMEGGEPAAYAYDAAGACLAQLAACMHACMLCFSAACEPVCVARTRHAARSTTHAPLRARGLRAEAPSCAAAAGQPPADPADAGAAEDAGAGADADAAVAPLPKEVTQPVWLLAFNRFAADRRRELRAENENRSGTEAERLIGIQWRSMPAVRARTATPPSASRDPALPNALRAARASLLTSSRAATLTAPG
jgi:hypothetical protein